MDWIPCHGTKNEEILKSNEIIMKSNEIIILGKQFLDFLVELKTELKTEFQVHKTCYNFVFLLKFHSISKLLSLPFLLSQVKKGCLQIY